MDNNYRYITLEFDKAKQPKFEEKKGKGFVEYGDDNNYAKYLLDLYNESPKHGAIIKSKSIYIFGQGFEVAGKANSKGESFNDILRRCVQDDEIFRGYYLQVIWNRAKQVSEIYHIDFQKVRVSKDLQTFYVKNDWIDHREKARVYPAFNIDNPVGSQIFYKKEYNPMSEVYPLPSYMQGLNYIESDIEVSRHILANAKRGWQGNTLVNLNNGDPVTEESKGEIERQLLKKFSGSDGKRVVIMFNKSKENAAEITDLGTSTLTKEDFTNVNGLIQQEIFASHQITSSEIFGISVPGALGSRTAMRDAYEIWNNTYCKNRQMEFDVIFTKFRNLKGEAGEFKIVPVEPLKFEFSENIMSQNLTQDEIRKIMGYEPLGNNAGTLTPQQGTPTTQPVTASEMAVNDSLRNLTGRQYQNVMRIVRNFGNGKLTKEQASLMLKSGYGFDDSQINAFLGVDDDPMTNDEISKFYADEDESLLAEFAAYGEDASQYTLLKSIPLGFAGESINQLEANIIEALNNNQDLDAEGIAKIVKQPVSDVQDALKNLEEKKIINITIKKVGNDIITKTEILKPLSELGGKQPKITETYIRYTYEWRVEGDLNTSRPFCQKLYKMSAHKSNLAAGGQTWSMAMIQQMSVNKGYSVLDRCGGWWTMPNGERSPQCRHQWVANIMIKK